MKQKNSWVPVTCKVLLTIALTFSSLQTLKAQDDPYDRMRKAAKAKPVSKSVLPSRVITTDNPIWKPVTGIVIPFKPIDMIDRNGRRISPDEIITLKTGKKITAKEFFASLNEIEQKLNAQGHSLRNNNQKVASYTVTPKKFLDGRVASLSKPIAGLRTEKEIKAILDPTKKIGDITLKPVGQYTLNQKNKLRMLNFTESKGLVSAKQINRKLTYATQPPPSSVPLKTIYNVSSKDWPIGYANTFQAGISGDLIREAKIFSIDPVDAEKNKMETRVIAKGRVYGSIYNNSMDLMAVKGEFFSTTDPSRNNTANLFISLGGIVVVNETTGYSDTKTFTGRQDLDINKDFPVRIPIVAGIDFVGRVGVEGVVGVEYGASLDRTFSAIQLKPLAEINGFAEAGVQLVHLLGGGVGINLTFLRGNLDLQAFIGSMGGNQEQLLIAETYYFGYEVSTLNGKLYCYFELCSPIPLPFIDDCYRKEHILFDWIGYLESGTIAEGNKQYIINRISKAGSGTDTR